MRFSGTDYAFSVSLISNARRFASAWKLYRAYQSQYDRVLTLLGEIDNPAVKRHAALSRYSLYSHALQSHCPRVWPSLYHQLADSAGPGTCCLSFPLFSSQSRQRLPRYELFLVEVLKVQSNEHVSEALSVLREVRAPPAKYVTISQCLGLRDFL